MPRLIPRLLQIISKQASLDKTSPFDVRNVRNRRKSLLNSRLPNPSFRPANHPRSVLLSSTPSNPITRSWHYFRHKSLPPRIYVPRRARTRPNDRDRPRKMSEDERRWWANPYLRMLSSPLRRCMVTNRYFPSEFLVRLGPVRVPESKPPNALLIPDGLQHTKFTARRVGRAVYALCSRHAFKYIQDRGQPLVRGQRAHPNLADYVAHLLRLRVLQELELLADQLEPSPNDSRQIIRRLTRSEWRGIKETGIIPFDDAVAVLVVPPLNKDPETGQRPSPVMAASPLPVDKEASRPSPPSLLHPSQSSPDYLVTTTNLDLLPVYQVPLYHGLTLFPNRHQRAALHSLLLRILGIERRSIQHHSKPKDVAKSSTRARGDAKHSHAFLVSSNSCLVRRGDVSATAIALWRVQMFEDGSLGIVTPR